MENDNELIRPDHKIVVGFIEPQSRVLDLGCGDGTLLSYLVRYKCCLCRGIEIDEKAIYQCIAKGLTVSHVDIDSGLKDFSSKRFDYVILHESLQQVLHPQKVILEALRVGRKVIVGIPNFCHIRARLQIFFQGRVPVTKELPYEWYDTPNLHFLTISDFREYCKEKNIKILETYYIGKQGIVKFLPNLFALNAIFVLARE